MDKFVSIFKMKNETYNKIKWIVTVILPAFSVFYGTIGKCWNIPYTSEICVCISALALFLGTCIGISSVQYRRENT